MAEEYQLLAFLTPFITWGN